MDRKKVLGILIAVAVLSVGFSFFGGVTWGDFLLNLGTEMTGAVVTYLLISVVLGTREEKEALISQFGSTVKDVAVAAAEELRRSGWLQDGSLKGASLVYANLEGANLAGANLQETKLAGANLEGANLREAHMEKSILVTSRLKEAFLVSAHLEGGSLQGAHMQGAHLEGAYLQGAHLRGADLQGAYLQKADLQGTDLTDAIYDVQTKWPDRFDPEAAGAKYHHPPESLVDFT